MQFNIISTNSVWQCQWYLVFWIWFLEIRKYLCRVTYFCLIYIYIYLSLFWWNYIHAFFFLFFLLINSSVPGIVFFIKNLSGFFLFVLLRNHHILEQVEKIILWKNNLRAHRVDFPAFSSANRNWWEKPCISHVVKYTIRWESDGRKVFIL